MIQSNGFSESTSQQGLVQTTPGVAATGTQQACHDGSEPGADRDAASSQGAWTQGASWKAASWTGGHQDGWWSDDWGAARVSQDSGEKNM